jgi:hypothetical protein
MSPIERSRITNEPMGLPSSEALRLAADVIGRRYVLPETMEHPQIRSECMRLAYLLMAYGLIPAKAPGGGTARCDDRSLARRAIPDWKECRHGQDREDDSAGSRVGYREAACIKAEREARTLRTGALILLSRKTARVARQFLLGATRVCFVMSGDSNRPGRVGWISMMRPARKSASAPTRQT